MPLYPYPKFMLAQLKTCKRIDDENWSFEIKCTIKEHDLRETITFSALQIQGIIDQKPCDDVMIIKDSSGKVKLTNCSRALGVSDPNSFIEGVYCSITGKLVREKGLPEVSAIKLTGMKAENNLLSPFWCNEVKDFQYFLAGVTEPVLEETD